MANITVIPASKTLHSKMPLNAQSRRKVAGYARVSTDSEEQLTSYEAQVDYYTKYIRSNPDWEFVDVYTDEGIFATNTRHRDGFNRMIADALAGKIDLIVTKSVSRFQHFAMRCVRSRWLPPATKRTLPSLRSPVPKPEGKQSESTTLSSTSAPMPERTAATSRLIFPS